MTTYHLEWISQQQSTYNATQKEDAKDPIEPLPEETRVIEIKAQLKEGNEKSALTDETIPIATKLAINDITKGCGLIVTVHCLKPPKNCEIYP